MDLATAEHAADQLPGWIHHDCPSCGDHWYHSDACGRLACCPECPDCAPGSGDDEW